MCVFISFSRRVVILRGPSGRSVACVILSRAAGGRQAGARRRLIAPYRGKNKPRAGDPPRGRISSQEAGKQPLLPAEPGKNVALTAKSRRRRGVAQGAHLKHVTSSSFSKIATPPGPNPKGRALLRSPAILHQSICTGSVTASCRHPPARVRQLGTGPAAAARRALRRNGYVTSGASRCLP